MAGTFPLNSCGEFVLNWLVIIECYWVIGLIIPCCFNLPTFIYSTIHSFWRSHAWLAAVTIGQQGHLGRNLLFQMWFMHSTIHPLVFILLTTLLLLTQHRLLAYRRRWLGMSLYLYFLGFSHTLNVHQILIKVVTNRHDFPLQSHFPLNLFVCTSWGDESIFVYNSFLLLA